jgi:pyridoxamine 5'-phosphate oxidase
VAFKYFSTIREVWFLATHPRLWGRGGLLEADVPVNPIELFSQWYHEATRSSWFMEFPNAMVLSTLSSEGIPQGRVVLMKGVDPQGVVFYTNKESQKGASIAGHRQVSLTFYWDSLQRQVRIEGVAEDVTDQESDAYFASRPRDSQIGAWASQQSRVLEHRGDLEEEVLRLRNEFGTEEIPRPPYWGGYRVIPDRIEFWQLRLSRLHDRIRYFRVNGEWSIERLAP